MSRSAVAYLDFIGETIARRPPVGLFNGVTAELAVLGVGPGDEELLLRVATDTQRPRAREPS